MRDERWIGTAAAAQRLGVKPETLYAYVSRGILRRKRRMDGRGSLFNVADLDLLAQHARARRSRASAELVIESAITAIVDDRPYYRGLAVTELAADRSLEEVATLLWSGELIGSGRWLPAADGVAAARAAESGLPTGTLLLERLQVIVAVLAAADPLRLHLDTPVVVTTAQNLIAGMVECLPGAAPGDRAAQPERREPSITARLWAKLTAQPAQPPLIDTLRAALVLLADHELAASTLAARVAASVRADPYAVVATGLGVVGGALHGGAALGAEAMLSEIDDRRDAARVIGERLRRGERIPGFGHVIYTRGDPRATFLLDRLRDAAPDSPRLAAAEAVLAEARRRHLPEPNIDFALAVLGGATGMVKSAPEAIFAIARSTGWLAHAIEEYASGTPLRPRAVYTGPSPEWAGAETHGRGVG